MANDLTQDPLIIDTPGAGTILQAVGAPFFIKGVKWVGAAAAAQVVIQDATTSRAIWEDVASVANYSSNFQPIELQVKGGIKVPTLSSGRLYIYLGSGVR